MDAGPARTAGGGRSGLGRRKGQPARLCQGVRGRRPLGTAGGTRPGRGGWRFLFYTRTARSRARAGEAPRHQEGLRWACTHRSQHGMGPALLLSDKQGGGGESRRQLPSPVATSGGGGVVHAPPAGRRRVPGRQASRVSSTHPPPGRPASHLRDASSPGHQRGGDPFQCVGGPYIMPTMHDVHYIRGGTRSVAAWEGGTCRSGVAATGSDAAKWACGRVRPSGLTRPHADLWTRGTGAPPPPATALFVEGRARVCTYGRWGAPLIRPASEGSPPRHCQRRGARRPTPRGCDG